jgi:hypothetical protein
MQFSTRSFFESTRHCRSAPSSGLFRRKSLTPSPFTYITSVSSTHTTNSFLPALTTTKTTTAKNMLVCQQKSVIVNSNENGNDNNSIFLTCAQLAACITVNNNNATRTLLIIDCGSPLRHTERRIQDSFLLNVNDKISRKRLSTRGLKNFLDVNQLNRLDKNEIIVLYDDTIRSSSSCASSPTASQLSAAMKCVYDEIKRYDVNKTIYVLQSSFDEFNQHHSSYCYISTSTDEDISTPTPVTTKPADIESFEMSEILSGLYLGNARDAEDLNLLKQNQIKTVINISTSIPCAFEDDKTFEYLRVPCHDTCKQNILQHFETTFEYIHKRLLADKKILVHCQGGVSRSPSFIIGYLMRHHSKTFDEAHNLVKTKRSIINPNLNFLGQLTQYQQMLTSA